jgi:uncharacterized metal-binding protein YceD (DUF177 family)
MAGTFVVKLSDLEQGPRKVTFEISERWLGRALADTDATTQGRAGELTVELTKNGRDVLVRGRAKVEVTVPCVVTLDPLPFELTPEIFLALEPRGESDARGKRKKGPKTAKARDKTEAAGEKPARSGRGRADPDDELSPEDAARDTFEGDEIVLDDFVREFILLEIPAYPRRSDLPSAEESLSSRPLAGPDDASRPVDPRLLPLQGILERLRGKQ